MDDLPSADAKPEDALVFFQQQTSTMDREALLARVAEAAAKEADAVTKLGQLTCARRRHHAAPRVCARWPLHARPSSVAARARACRARRAAPPSRHPRRALTPTHTRATYAPRVRHARSFKLAAKEKLMDDLRAGLVAAGRAVSEAQQEAETVKKSVAQQEASMSAKYGTSIDVLKRLGEVTCVPVRRQGPHEARLCSCRVPAPQAGTMCAVPLPCAIRLHARTGATRHARALARTHCTLHAPHVLRAPAEPRTPPAAACPLRPQVQAGREGRCDGVAQV